MLLTESNKCQVPGSYNSYKHSSSDIVLMISPLNYIEVMILVPTLKEENVLGHHAS